MHGSMSSHTKELPCQNYGIYGETGVDYNTTFCTPGIILLLANLTVAFCTADCIHFHVVDYVV